MIGGGGSGGGVVENKMSNFFDVFAKKFKDSPVVIWVHVLSWLLFFAGVMLTVEDVASSRYGIQMLEQTYGIKPVNYSIMYWVISIVPTLATVVFFYAYLVEPKGWYIGVAAWFAIMDNIADIQMRTGGQFITAQGLNFDATTVIGGLLSLSFYTVGSELFLSTSVGLILVTFVYTVEQYKKQAILIGKAVTNAKREIGEANRQLLGGNQRQEQRHNDQRQQHNVQHSNNNRQQVAPQWQAREHEDR